jgi:hypothetical protein
MSDGLDSFLNSKKSKKDKNKGKNPKKSAADAPKEEEKKNLADQGFDEVEDEGISKVVVKDSKIKVQSAAEVKAQN